MDPDRRAAWVNAIQNVETRADWQPSKHSVVCSLHFHADDFRLDRGVTLVKQHAVPAVFNSPHVAASVCSIDTIDKKYFICLFTACNIIVLAYCPRLNIQ